MQLIPISRKDRTYCSEKTLSYQLLTERGDKVDEGPGHVVMEVIEGGHQVGTCLIRKNLPVTIAQVRAEVVMPHQYGDELQENTMETFTADTSVR